MDCLERDRLRSIHAEAVLEWTNAGGTDTKKAKDVVVVEAWKKVVKAEKEVLKHRKKHGC